MKLHLDFETTSDLDLSIVGLWNYLRHPTTKVLLAAWAIDDGPIEQCDFLDGFERLATLTKEADEIHAWNAPFEEYVLSTLLGIDVPISKMFCTMSHALYRAFPASLDECAKALLGRSKPPDSTRLINTWSLAKRRPRPGDWERFCEYNRNDVALERDIARSLARYPWPAHERDIWKMSEDINRVGVPVDLPGAYAAADKHAKMTREALGELAVLTGVSNPNSASQLAKYFGVTSLVKADLAKLIDRASGTRKRALELRRDVAMSAPKKFESIIARATPDMRLHDTLQYSGAGRTHRWSGRGVQVQNLRRGPADDLEIARRWRAIHQDGEVTFTELADCVRSVIGGHGGLVVADYSSIEVVMLHWAAADSLALEYLADGGDPYKRFAAQYFKARLDAVTKPQRTFAKPVVLGCGYGLGADRLVEYAAGMGVEMTPQGAAAAVAAYRKANPRVVAFWRTLEEAATTTLREHRPHFAIERRFRFRWTPDALLLRLPSGSEITYWNARETSDGLAYDGVAQATGRWSEVRTWGGKLVENVVQSISRDVLVYGLQRACKAGLRVVLHVHDEIVVEPHPGALETLLQCMTAPDWCHDAPIRAAGFGCPRYRKD